MLHDGFILAGIGCAAAGLVIWSGWVLFVQPLLDDRRRDRELREFSREWGGVR